MTGCFGILQLYKHNLGGKTLQKWRLTLIKNRSENKSLRFVFVAVFISYSTNHDIKPFAYGKA